MNIAKPEGFEELGMSLDKIITSIVKREIESKLSNLSEKPFLTINEVAEYLGISIHTLYSYNTKKVISFQKVGKTIYYLREDLKSFVMDKSKRVRSDEELEQIALTKKYCKQESNWL